MLLNVLLNISATPANIAYRNILTLIRALGFQIHIGKHAVKKEHIGGYFHLESNLMAWHSKKQNVV